VFFKSDVNTILIPGFRLVDIFNLGVNHLEQLLKKQSGPLFI